MAKRNRNVSIKVHKKFFDNVFEKERKKMERDMGFKVSQIKFTEYLANVKFKFPKMDLPRKKRKRKR